MRKSLVLTLLAFFVSGTVLGQRVVRRVIPPPEESLRFDSNDFPLTILPLSQSPDFNFSPNVVFTPDSKKGFVAYPGRETEDGDRVLAFDVQTAEVLALIEVGPNPFFLTLTPDGTRVAVAALFLTENTPSSKNGFNPMKLGSISMIDVDTYTTQRLDFDDVGFSVFNNIVFTSDGSSGFIASAVTDEIIRFNPETLSEVGPRLKLEGGSRPASLTMSNSSSFMLVVLPGSNALPIEEVPDSIQIIDTASLSVTASIVPEPTETFVDIDNTIDVPHNFFGANNVSISGDDKYAIIGDRENSAASFIPELAGDHALILNLEERSLELTLSMGGGTGASRVSPNGQFFALISAVDLLFFDTSLMQGIRASSGNSQFRESSRPAFSADSSRAYVASPILDLLNVYEIQTAALTHSVRVGLDFERNNFQVPAGPLDVAVTPDGETISVVNFNGNDIELLKNTSRLTSPQLIAENIDTIESGSGADPEIIPAENRFFSGLAITNYGDQSAEVIMTASGFVQANPTVTGFFISASPNPIQVCAVGGLGKTTLTWDVTDVATSVEIRSGTVDGPVVATGSEMGTHETGEDVEDQTTFFLIDAVTGDLLDTVRVTHSELGCPAPFLVVSPTTIQVCDDSPLGRTTVFWDTNGITARPEVRIDSADGPLFTNIGPTGSQQTGRWVVDGMKFFLVDGTNGDVLDEDTVRLTDAGCPLSITQVLEPDQQISLITNRFLESNKALQEQALGSFDGWANIDTDFPTVAGIFLTYDGVLNRIDGGPISSETKQTSIFPVIQLGNGLSTIIEVTNPTLTTATVLFDLFDSAGDLVATSLQRVVGTDQRSFPILGDPDDRNSIGIYDFFTGLNLIRAFPNSIQVCGMETTGQTTISWDATGFAESIEIRVGSPDGTVFFVSGDEDTNSDGIPDVFGSMETGEDVADGTTYFLIDAETGEVLDMTTVTHNELGCPPAYLDATPNPIRVCDGGEFGLTVLQWNATDMATNVEIRIGTAMGEVFATGEATGFFTTGRTVSDGMVFHLVNADSGASLDTETIKIIRTGCPLEGFTEGYLRMASPGTVSFQNFGDERRMSILAAQDSSTESTHFVIPHFVAFDGSETILTLLHPSSIPLAGFVRLIFDEDGKVIEQEEEPPEEPILVTVTLRANDGSELAAPLELELADGVLQSGTIRELFGLQDPGESVTGWIEVTANLGDLVGLAEIRTFNGEAASAVALQPVEGKNFVFSHVAEGFGFGTGLALVNPGTEPAQVTVELRNQDGMLLGTLGPTNLAPGERLIGLISELFPDAGELLGGTIKIFSDQPLGNLELFFSLNERLLSVVPTTRID